MIPVWRLRSYNELLGFKWLQPAVRHAQPLECASRRVRRHCRSDLLLALLSLRTTRCKAPHIASPSPDHLAAHTHTMHLIAKTCKP